MNRPSVRLNLEALENRCVPSYVTTGPPELSAAATDLAGIGAFLNQIVQTDRAAAAQLARAAWDGIAAELAASAQSYDNVVTQLASEEWLGPASAAMASAAAPYVQWMNTTAAQAEQVSVQAAAQAAAYEQAIANVVPPPLVTANRSELAALVAAGFLGQNTPAIMATEAEYMEMWAQDVAAMTKYLDASGGFQ
jgi:PPE-repeat protein